MFIKVATVKEVDRLVSATDNTLPIYLDLGLRGSAAIRIYSIAMLEHPFL